ncbi:MAG: MMPL family transporter [Candidatus Nanopelagicaceae bacterium]
MSVRGRKPLWIAIIVVVAWLGVAGTAGPLFGKLSTVQKNDNSDFLPKNAESFKFTEEYKAFSDGSDRAIPALVLFTGDITQDTVATANAFLQTLPSKSLVDHPEEKIGDYLIQGAPIFAFPSQDGKALLGSISFDSKLIGNQIGNEPALPIVVESIRNYSEDFAKSGGYEAHVTGFAAIFADLFKAFGGIDSTLLLATLAIVSLILIIVYRSPFLWIFPLFSALIAESMAGAVIYLLAKNDILTVDGQSQGILSVLVIGAATDYALLLIARYREELHKLDSRFEAMGKALRGVLEPIIASGSTVTLGLLVLLLSELKNNRSLGPVGAIGIVSAMVTILTLLPAILVLFGRWVFWPRIPRHDDIDEKLTGFWSKVANATANSPKKFAAVTSIILILMVALVPTLKANGISTLDGFTKKPKSLVGQELLLQHFPGGQNQPTQIIISKDKAEQVINALQKIDGVASVAPEIKDPANPLPKVVNDKLVVDATLVAPADSNDARALVPSIRQAAQSIDSTALVGGTSAVFYDVDVASRHDRNLIIPIVLIIIAIILALLLRSILAAAVLLATVILSFAATLGASAFVFNHIFKFPGADTSFPLFTFVFLVALGIDYNIFLMTRVREETLKIGTRAGTIKGVTVTGGVITSAGIVLAATFTVLGVLPLVALAEIAFAVAFGVLLDTLVVRSLLVPALVHILGKRIWWPAKLEG